MQGLTKEQLFAPNPVANANARGALWNKLQQNQTNMMSSNNDQATASFTREARLKKRAEERRRKRAGGESSFGGFQNQHKLAMESSMTGGQTGTAFLFQGENNAGISNHSKGTTNTDDTAGGTRKRDMIFEEKKRRFLEKQKNGVQPLRIHNVTSGSPPPINAPRAINNNPPLQVHRPSVSPSPLLQGVSGDQQRIANAHELDSQIQAKKAQKQQILDSPGKLVGRPLSPVRQQWKFQEAVGQGENIIRSLDTQTGEKQYISQSLQQQNDQRFKLQEDERRKQEYVRGLDTQMQEKRLREQQRKHTASTMRQPQQNEQQFKFQEDERRRQEYVRGLDAQMEEKRLREEQRKQAPSPIRHTQQNEQLQKFQQDERRRQEYVRGLDAQMEEKRRASHQSQRRTMSPIRQQDSQQLRFQEDERRRQEYVRGLDAQVEEKRLREQQRQHTSSPIRQPQQTDEQLKFREDERRRQEYVRGLDAQIEEKRLRDQQRQQPNPYRPTGVPLSFTRTDEESRFREVGQKSLEYVRALDAQVEEKHRRERQNNATINRHVDTRLEQSPRESEARAGGRRMRLNLEAREKEIEVRKQEEYRRSLQSQIDAKHRQVEEERRKQYIPSNHVSSDIEQRRQADEKRKRQQELANDLRMQVKLKEEMSRPVAYRETPPVPLAARDFAEMERDRQRMLKEEYARDLQNQIFQKQQHQQQAPGGRHHQYHMAPPPPPSHNNQAEEEAREAHRRKLQYAADLKAQMLRKRQEQQVSNPVSNRQYQGRNMQNGLSPRTIKLQKQQQYARDLAEQQRIKQQQQQHPHINNGSRRPNYHVNSVMPPQDLQRLEKLRRQQEYARELQLQLEMRENLRHGGGSQPYNDYHNPMNPHQAVTSNHGGFMDEKMAKKYKQMAYLQDLQQQQLQKNQMDAYRKAAELQQQNQYQMQNGLHSTNGGSSPTRAHLQSQVFAGLPTPQNNMPLISPGFPLGGEVTPQQQHALQSSFTRYKADLSDPSVQNELLEKKRKQLTIQQQLEEQIALSQARRKQEAEEKKRLEGEEEARLQRERIEIQEAYEKEKADQKRKQQQEHQEGLRKQIEDKKRQKELEQEADRKREEAEEAKLKREREELEARFKNGGRKDDTGPELASKAGLFDPPSPIPESSENAPEGNNKMPGTAQLFQNPSPVPTKEVRVTPRPIEPRQVAAPAMTRTSLMDDDAIKQLLRETQAAKSEQIKTRAALETVKIKLDRIGGVCADDNFRRDVLGYGFYDLESSYEVNRSFRENAGRVLTPPEQWGPTKTKVPRNLEEFDVLNTKALKSRSPVASLELSSLPSTGMHSPSIDLMKSLYPQIGSQGISTTRKSASKDDLLRGSLRSESKFIFPNGKAVRGEKLRKNPENDVIVPRPVKLQLSKLNESESKDSVLSPNIEYLQQRKNNVTAPRPVKLQLSKLNEPESKDSVLSPNIEYLQQRKQKVEDIEAIKDQKGGEQEEAKEEGEVVYEESFDIHKLHQFNCKRLEKLQTVGDCSNLKGDQLDAFLEEFLNREEFDGSTIAKNFKDREAKGNQLDCETRWIKKRY